jgi:hypothetical protein
VNDDQGFSLGVEVNCLLELADKLNIIVHSDYFASCVGLNVPLSDLSRLIVKEAVGVSAPSHTSHVDSKNRSEIGECYSNL